MPSSWSPSLRFELQFAGENINLWGDKLNAVLAHADYAVAGWLTKPLTGSVALTTANAADDEARAAMLKFTGAGPFTVTLPSVSKAYAVWNACTGAITLTTGAGTIVTLEPGDMSQVFCDGANLKTPGFGGSSLKGYIDAVRAYADTVRAYVDTTAWAANAGVLPGQGGAAGRFLKTDGTTAGWGSPASSDLTDLAAFIQARRGEAIAFALVL